MIDCRKEIFVHTAYNMCLCFTFMQGLNEGQKMRPSIGLHLALIVICGGILPGSIVFGNQLPKQSQEDDT